MEYIETNKVLINIGKYVKDTYKLKLKERDKIASGTLYNSIDFKIEITEKGVKLYFVADKHYLNVENGRKAGGKMPPPDVILRWMKLKGIQPNGKESLRNTAFKISRSISKKGIKPNPFLKNIKKSLVNYIDDIKIAIAKDLNITVKSILSKNITNQNKHIQFKIK